MAEASGKKCVAEAAARKQMADASGEKSMAEEVRNHREAGPALLKDLSLRLRRRM